MTEYNRRKRFASWREPPEACDCCGEALVVFTSNSLVYRGREHGEWPMIYACLLCGAFVGCHKHSVYPMGTMADAETRAMRRELHAMIDPLWRDSNTARSMVYRTMGGLMGFDGKREFHVGELSREECLQANERFRAWQIEAEFGR